MIRKSELYKAFLSNDSYTNDGICKKFAFDYKGKQILLSKTLKKATKRVIVTCAGHTVSGVHLYPVTHHTVASEDEFHIDVANMIDGNNIPIVVISGKPGLIKGLDEGLFVSANGSPKDKKFVYVMSEARFKSFDLTDC